VVSCTANLLGDCELRAVVRTLAGDGKPQTGWPEPMITEVLSASTGPRPRINL